MQGNMGSIRLQPEVAVLTTASSVEPFISRQPCSSVQQQPRSPLVLMSVAFRPVEFRRKSSSSAAFTGLSWRLPSGVPSTSLPGGPRNSRTENAGPSSDDGVPPEPLSPESSSGSADISKAFKSTVELDRLIDTLRATEYEKLPQVVAENILAFNTTFWLRLATRADLSDADEQKGFEELANTVMQIVHLIVQKTQERIESSTSILKSILTPLIEKNGDINWPPRNPQGIFIMRKEVQQRVDGGSLDESFLSEVSAQMRQAREDGDKPGLVAILQKVLQLYCSTVLSKRTYATQGDKIDAAEALLEQLISGDEESWNDMIRNGLVFGGGSVESSEFARVVDKRVERTLMRTESGSYQQRLLIEYVKEIQTRASLLEEAFTSAGPSFGSRQ